MRTRLASAPALVLTPLLLAQGHPVLDKLRAAAADAPVVVAHRGSSSTHPENTLAAFRAAIAAEAEVVELDVYQTKDGEWVCFHDKTVDRTTDAVAKLGREKLEIKELTLEEVRRLDAGSWFGKEFADEKVPTLAEALDVLLPAAVPMIERKDGDAVALVDELRRLGVIDDVLVQAFDWDFLKAVHAAEPRLLLGALGDGDLSAPRQRAIARTGARLVHWNHRTLTTEAATAVRTAGRLLCVYTVNPDVTLLGAAAIGCDMVTTDRPARMAELRRRGLLAARIRIR